MEFKKAMVKHFAELMMYKSKNLSQAEWIQLNSHLGMSLKNNRGL